jgi:hypothetical protein
VAAARIGRFIYVVGGFERQSGRATAAVERYDIRRNRWRRVRPATTPRAAHALAVIGHRLYAAGDANDSGSLRSLEIYDFRRRRWLSGPSLPGPARNHTTGVASGGSFYVLAGRDAGNFTVAELCDPRRRRWKRLPTCGRHAVGSRRLAWPTGVRGRAPRAGRHDDPRGLSCSTPHRRRWTRLLTCARLATASAA